MFLRMVLLLLSQAPAPTPQDIFQQGRFAEAAALLERGDFSSGGRYLLWLCYQQMGGVGEGGDGAGGFGWEGAEVGAGGLCSRSVLFGEGKFPEALGAVVEAERLGEPVARTRRLIGTIEEERGNWEAALAAYDAALNVDPNFSEAHSGRASVLFKLTGLAEA